MNSINIFVQKDFGLGISFGKSFEGPNESVGLWAGCILTISTCWHIHVRNMQDDVCHYLQKWFPGPA